MKKFSAVRFPMGKSYPEHAKLDIMRLPLERPNTFSDWRPPTPPSLDGVTEIGFDTETDGLDWRHSDRPIGASIVYGPLSNRKRYYLPWGHRGGGNIDPAVMKRWFQREVRGKILYGLNIKFDAHMMNAWGIDFEEQDCKLRDVGHYMALLDDHRRHFDLESISRDILGRGKVGGLDITNASEYHAAEISEYAMTDADLVFDLKHALWPLLTQDDLHRVRELEDDVTYAVMEMERNAAPLDVELLDRWVKECTAEYERCLWAIYELTDLRVNPNTVGDMIRLFRKLRLDITLYTEQGQPSFADDVLAAYQNPEIQLARRAKKLDSLLSKFLLKYQECARRFGGKFIFGLHQLRTDEESGTITGRFSSSAVKLADGKVGGNSQQIPDKDKQLFSFGGDIDYIVRQLFIPPKGQHYLSADAKQVEFRVFAHYAKSQKLYDAYAKDPDMNFHRWCEKMIRPSNPDIIYGHVKNATFTKLFGGGPRKFATTAGISLEAAEEINAAYDAEIPEVKTLLNRCSQTAERRGWVKTITGRRMRFPTAERSYKALNNIIQGTAADINKKKMIELHRNRKKLGITLSMSVHDEATGWVPDEAAAYAVQKLLNEQSFPLRVDVLWDVAIGDNWAACDKPLPRVA